MYRSKHVVFILPEILRRYRDKLGHQRLGQILWEAMDYTIDQKCNSLDDTLADAVLDEVKDFIDEKRKRDAEKSAKARENVSHRKDRQPPTPPYKLADINDIFNTRMLYGVSCEEMAKFLQSIEKAEYADINFPFWQFNFAKMSVAQKNNERTKLAFLFRSDVCAEEILEHKTYDEVLKAYDVY